MAAMAVMVVLRRPAYTSFFGTSLPQTINLQRVLPMSSGRRPVAMLWLKGASMTAFTISGDESASPIYSRRLSVRIRAN